MEKLKVSLDDVKVAFDDLIEERKSREELANWALKLQIADDNQALEYDPPKGEPKIWEGILYLMGVDLKDTDSSYLHSIESFIDFRQKYGL